LGTGSFLTGIVDKIHDKFGAGGHKILFWEWAIKLFWALEGPPVGLKY
jgi:hypothetical protein